MTRVKALMHAASPKWGTMSGTAASSSKRHFQQLTFAIALSAIASTNINSASAAELCDGCRVMRASVVAFDQPMMINRLGTNRPQGMIYALLRDVVRIDLTRPLGPGM